MYMPDEQGPSNPERVCRPCGAELRPLQEQLAATRAGAHRVNNLADHQNFVPEGLKQFTTGVFTRDLAASIRNATHTLNTLEDPLLVEDKRIPKAILEAAQGFAFITFMRVAVIGGLRMGSGLVILKKDDGSWSAPSGIGLTGFSAGFVHGIDKVNLCLVFTNKSACRVLVSKGQLNLGAELGATVGPIGRTAMGGASFGQGGMAPVVAYSQSVGLFVGIDVNGCWIKDRKEQNQRFYGLHYEPSEILTGNVPQPEAGRPLYEALHRLTTREEPPVNTGVPEQMRTGVPEQMRTGVEQEMEAVEMRTEVRTGRNGVELVD